MVVRDEIGFRQFREQLKRTMEVWWMGEKHLLQSNTNKLVEEQKIYGITKEGLVVSDQKLILKAVMSRNRKICICNPRTVASLVNRLTIMKRRVWHGTWVKNVT